VADLVTPALRAELVSALGEASPIVQDAVVHLAQRLNEKDVTQVLMESVTHESTIVAVNAMRCLGRLKLAGASDILLNVLKATKQPERLIACCEALGRLADPASVEPLAAIAAPKGFLFFRKRWPVPVRAAAASALVHVPDPRVKQVMAALAMDVDPRLFTIGRQAAKLGH
jgi:HEAT repeat protein